MDLAVLICHVHLAKINRIRLSPVTISGPGWREWQKQVELPWAIHVCRCVPCLLRAINSLRRQQGQGSELAYRLPVSSLISFFRKCEHAQSATGIKEVVPATASQDPWPCFFVQPVPLLVNSVSKLKRECIPGPFRTESLVLSLFWSVQPVGQNLFTWYLWIY